MPILENIINSLLESAIANPLILFLISFIAIALWGDVSMVLLVTLAIPLKISLWIVFIGAYLGAQFGDAVWFLLGRQILPSLEERRKFVKRYKTIIQAISKIARGNDLLTISAIKFLFGTRIITVVYLAGRRLSFLKFLFYNSIAALIWVAFMGSLGYLIAIGFASVLRIFKNIQIAVTILILFLIILKIVQRKISERLRKNK